MCELRSVDFVDFVLYQQDCRWYPHRSGDGTVLELTDPAELVKRVERTGPWALGGALHGTLGTSIVLRVPETAVSPALVQGLNAFCCRVGTKILIREPGEFEGYCCTITKKPASPGTLDEDKSETSEESITHLTADDKILITCDNAEASHYDLCKFNENITRSFKLQAWNFVLSRSFSDYTEGKKLVVFLMQPTQTIDQIKAHADLFATVLAT